MPPASTTGETMHTKLYAYLESLDLGTLESSTIPVTQTRDLTIKLVSREEQLPPATGLWIDFVARNIMACLEIAEKNNLVSMPLTTCFVHKNVGYRFDIEVNAAKPKQVESTPTEPTTLSTPTRPRFPSDLPYPAPNRVPNIPTVSGNPVRRDNR
jgi:hypothetical protein